MRESLLRLSKLCLHLLSVGLVFLLPLFFLTNVSNVLDYPKLVLLVGATLILTTLWAIKSVLERKLVLAQTPLGVPLVVLVAVFMLSTWFSLDKTASLIGSFGLWHWSLVGLTSLVVLYTLVTSNLEEKSQLEHLKVALLTSGCVLGVLAVTGYVLSLTADASALGQLGIFGEVLRGTGFNLVGGAKPLILFLAALLPLALGGLLRSYREQKWLYFVLHSLFAIVLSLALVLWVSPYLPGIKSQVTPEASLGLGNSWRVSISSLRDHALLGSGPGTFGLDFSRYRPVYMNQDENWGMGFARPFNEYLEVVATLGMAGVLSFSFLFYRLGWATGRSLGLARIDKSVLVAVGVVLMGWFLTPSNLVTTFLLFVLLSLWMGQARLAKTNLAENVVLSVATLRERFGANDSLDKGDQANVEILPWVFLAVSLVALIGGGYGVARDFRSNIAYTRSLRLLVENAPGIQIYDTQRDAINLNPFRDVYRRAYAQTNLALANSIASQTQQTEKISEQDRTNISTLIQQAIAQVRVISESLGVFNVQNWIVRGQIYESLIGVAEGAPQWAIGAYQSAIQLEPSNPSLRIQLGGLYYGQQMFEEAEESFKRAVELKPDLANAHFNYAAALRENGKLGKAQAELDLVERMVGEQVTSIDKEQLEAERAKLEEAIATQPTPTPILAP